MTTQGAARAQNTRGWRDAARWLPVVAFVASAVILINSVIQVVTGATADVAGASRAVFPTLLASALTAAVAMWRPPRALPRWPIILGAGVVGGFAAVTYASISFNTPQACSFSSGPTPQQWAQVTAAGIDPDSIIALGPHHIQVPAGTINCTASSIDGSTELQWQVPLLEPIHGIR